MKNLARFIPDSLMARYTMALTAIGLLIIFEQVVTQIALRREVDDQQVARLVEVQLNDLQRLSKAALGVQLSTRDGELAEQSRAFAELSSHFSDREASIEKGAHRAEVEAAFSKLGLSAFNFAPYKAASRAHHSFSAKERFEIRKLAQSIEAAGSDYRAALRTLLTALDDRSTARITTTTRVELALFALVIVVLLLEGLYIFRPSLRALEDSLRMRSSFMSRMSHEIRNPMNAIIGMADVLFETPLNDLQKRYLTVLSRSSQTLLELLNSLLDFSSLEDGKVSVEKIDFDLHEVLAKVVDLSAVRAHEKNLELSLDLAPETPLSLNGDPVRLGQVLSNLISNAIKFTSTGDVRVKVNPGRTSSGASVICFSVKDSGIGIKPEALSKIFESFVQADTSTRRQFGGSGLGLTIARDLVRLMGGDLQVDSAIGIGSEFRFSVPLASANPEDTLAWRLREHRLCDRTAFLLGPMTRTMAHAAELIRAAGGLVENRLENVELDSSSTIVLISPLADDSTLQFLPDRLGSKTRVICLIETILPSGRLKDYLRFGVTDFVMAPLKPLEFIPFIAAAQGDANAVNDANASVLAPEPSAKKMKVLVVDDAQENRDLMQLYLSGRSGLELIFAIDGLQALQKFKADSFDLVLTDIQMPVMDGIEEFIAIREWEREHARRSVPIAAITADSRPEARLNLLRLGFEGVLIKPLRKSEIFAWLDSRSSTVVTNDLAPETPPGTPPEKLAELNAQS